MYDVETDRAENRLYIDLTGDVDPETIRAAADEVERGARRLRSGFDVVNDLRGFRVPSPEDARPIKEAQATLKQESVDRVIRVTDGDTSSVVLRAFERRSEDVGYTGEVADSVEEAERLLEEEAVTGYHG